MKAFYTPIILALVLIGCDSTYAEPESLGTIGGIDLDLLFEPPGRSPR